LHRLAAVDGDGTYVEAKSKMLWLRPFGVVLSLEPDVLDGAQAPWLQLSRICEMVSRINDVMISGFADG
jgi:hypothetical protein